MSDARLRILSRLKAAPPRPAPALPEWVPPTYGEGRIERFVAMLEANHAEVHHVTASGWPATLDALLAARGLRTLLFAPGTPLGARLAEAWGDDQRLLPYDQPVEALKPTLVHDAEAGITAAKGGIAETGTLILWPSVAEPRLMSLLPPLHIVVVEAATLVDNLAQAVTGWAQGGMPTNALLISGPSKTADIEQTLAYGVHGPKELMVLIVT